MSSWSRSSAPHATPSMIEDAQLSHVEQVEFWQPRPDTDFSELRGQYRRAALYLFERCGVGARVLEAALRCKDDEVIAKAFAKADLAWRSERGRSVLHVLCRMGHVDGVRALLDRRRRREARRPRRRNAVRRCSTAWVEHRGGQRRRSTSCCAHAVGRRHRRKQRRSSFPMARGRSARASCTRSLARAS